MCFIDLKGVQIADLRPFSIRRKFRSQSAFRKKIFPRGNSTLISIFRAETFHFPAKTDFKHSSKMAAVNKSILLKKKLLLLLLLRKRKLLLMGNEKAKPRFWMRRLFKEREKKGLYNILVKDLKLHDSEYFFKSFRMTPSQLDLLHSWIAPSIVKSSLRRSVAGTEERLCIALRYLVTGDAQVTISTSYRHSPQFDQS